MSALGYVVRGTDGDGVSVYADDDGDGIISRNPDEGTMVADAPNRPALDVAAGMRAEMVRLGCADARIFAVAEDGTETPLPTYEEALEKIDEMRSLLKSLEWAGDANGSRESCCPCCGATASPDCGNRYPGRGMHETTCSLAAALEGR